VICLAGKHLKTELKRFAAKEQRHSKPRIRTSHCLTPASMRIRFSSNNSAEANTSSMPIENPNSLKKRELKQAMLESKQTAAWFVFVLVFPFCISKIIPSVLADISKCEPDFLYFQFQLFFCLFDHTLTRLCEQQRNCLLFGGKKGKNENEIISAKEQKQNLARPCNSTNQQLQKNLNNKTLEKNFFFFFFFTFVFCF
jgi:hypothetical protein